MVTTRDELVRVAKVENRCMRALGRNGLEAQARRRALPTVEVKNCGMRARSRNGHTALCTAVRCQMCKIEWDQHDGLEKELCCATLAYLFPYSKCG